MPTVPRIEKRAVTEQALGGARFVSDAPLVTNNIPQALAKVPGIINSAAKLQKQESDIAFRTQRDSVDIAFNTLIQEAHGPDGVMQSRGINSQASQDQELEKWNKKKEELLSLAPSQRAKDYVEKAFSAKITPHSISVNRHTSKEMNDYSVSEGVALIDSERNVAVANYLDPDAVNISIAKQKQKVNELAEQQNMGPEEKKALMQKTVSSTRTDVATQILSGVSFSAADAYVKRHSKDFTSNDREHINNALKNGKLREQSTEISDKLYGESPSMGDAIEKADNIKDVELRAETKRRIREKDADIQRFNLGGKIKLDGDLNDVLEKNFGNVDAIPDNLKASLTSAQQKGINERSRMIKAGEVPERLSPAYYDLESQTQNPSRFAKVNLNDFRYVNKIHPADLEKLREEQNDITNKGKSGGKKLRGIESKRSIVNDSLRSQDLRFGSKASSDEVKRANKFRREVDMRVVELQDSLGREATNEEIRQITDNLHVKVLTDEGIIFDTFKPVFEVTMKDIPDEEQIKIRDALRRRGQVVNDRNVIKLFNRKFINPEQ